MRKQQEKSLVRAGDVASDARGGSRYGMVSDPTILCAGTDPVRAERIAQSN